MIAHLTMPEFSPSSTSRAQTPARQSVVADHLGALLGAMGRDDYAAAKDHFTKLDQALATQDILSDADRAIRASLDTMKAGFAADDASQIRGGFLDFIAEVRLAAAPSLSTTTETSKPTERQPLISNMLLTELLSAQAAQPDTSPAGTAHTIASAVARGHGIVLTAEESRRHGFVDAEDIQAACRETPPSPARPDNDIENIYATVQQGGKIVAVVYRNGTIGGLNSLDLPSDSGQGGLSLAESRLTSLLRSLTGAQVRYGADAIVSARKTDWIHNSDRQSAMRNT